MSRWYLVCLCLCIISPLFAQDSFPIADRVPLTPENVMSLVPLTSWGDGHLRDISWTEEGYLRVLTDNEERLYNPESLKQPVSVGNAWPNGLKSPDGKLFLISGERWGKSSLRDYETGDIVAVIEGGSALFDNTGRFLVVSQWQDNVPTIDVYDLTQPTQPQRIQTFKGKGDQLLVKDHWVISRDKTALYALDIETASVVSLPFELETSGEYDRFTDVWLSLDQTFLAMLHQGQYPAAIETLLVYNIADLSSPTRVIKETFPEEGSRPTLVAWSPDNQRYFVSRGASHTIYKPDGNQHYDIDWILDEFTLVDVLLASFGADNSLLAIHSSELGMEVYGLRIYRGRELISEVRTDRVLKIALSPDSRFLAVMDSDTSVRILNTETLEQVGILNQDVFDGFLLNPDETQVQTRGKTYDLATQEIVVNAPPLYERASLDQTLMVATNGDAFPYEFYILDVRIDEYISVIKGAFTGAESPRFSPDNRLFAIFEFARGDAKQDHMFLYDVQTGILLKTVDIGFAPAQTVIGDAAFSGNSSMIAYSRWGSDPNQLGVYNIQTHESKIFEIVDIRIDEQTVALNNDGSMVFTASAQEGVMVWDTATGDPILVPALAAVGPVRHVKMTKDGSRLYTVNYEGRFTIWGLPESP